MKILILLCVIFPMLGQTQLTDTTCIKSRWIALKPTQQHADIFCLDSTIPADIDMIRVIQTMVEEYKINLYGQNSGVNLLREWYDIDYATELAKAREDKTNFENWRPYFMLYGPQSDLPLTDEYGEPLIRLGEDGFEEYVYPPRDVYYFPTRIINEIRIKEERVYNETTKTYQFTPVGMSFYFKANTMWNFKGHELFWIDINELTKAIQETGKSYPWYDAIINKQYNGFQYMQVSCYDAVVKY